MSGLFRAVSDILCHSASSISVADRSSATGATAAVGDGGTLYSFCRRWHTNSVDFSKPSHTDFRIGPGNEITVARGRPLHPGPCPTSATARPRPTLPPEQPAVRHRATFNYERPAPIQKAHSYNRSSGQIKEVRLTFFEQSFECIPPTYLNISRFLRSDGNEPYHHGGWSCRFIYVKRVSEESGNC